MGVAPRPGPVLGSYASRSQTSSLAILHAAIMIRPLLSIGALVVLAAVAESASITDLFASYGKSANSYGGGSYGKSTSSSGEDSYNEQEHYKEDSYKKDDHHEKDEPSYRHKSKRSAGLVTREERVLARWEAVFGSRHAQSDCKCSAACLNVIPAFHRNLPAFSGL